METLGLETLVQHAIATGKELEHSQAPVIAPIDIDPRKKCYWFNGELKTYDVPPALRKHTVSTLADLISATAKWGKPGVIFVDAAAVTLFIDDNDRRESVKLPLEETPLYTVLSTIGREAIDQAAFARYLRRELRTIGDQTALLSAVRNVRWQTTEGGSAGVDHGKESLNVNVERQLSGIDASFPEYAGINANAYVGFDKPYSFELTIDVLIQQKRFRVAPQPGQLEECQLIARLSIQDELRAKCGKDVTVLLGSM